DEEIVLGGGWLAGKEVEKVVTLKRASVRAACLPVPCRPVTVTVTVTIDPGGKVTSTSLMGDRVVGACIERLAKTWTFPTSKAGGTFAIPFIFAC
ncbi:MAG: hypothetical protein ACXVEE_42695, partial [Polyangiales bacterium]